MAGERTGALLRQMDQAFRQESWFPPLADGVAGVTAAQAAWVAGSGANTIWQIVNHVTFWKEFGIRRLHGEPRTGERIDNNATFGAPGDPEDSTGWAAAVERLHGAQAALREAVAGMADTGLDQALPGESYTRGELIVDLLQHDIYHGGQVLLLRKLQGAWPARR